MKRKEWTRLLVMSDCKPHSLFLWPALGDKLQKPRMKEWILVCGEEGVKGRGSNFVSVPHHSTPLSIGNKLNTLSHT